MRFLLFALVLFAAACAPQPRAGLDPLAERYVRLALEIGAHEEGYVDAYFGPPAWREAAEAAPRPVAALKSAADALVADHEALPALSGEAARRRAWLIAAVRSARFRLDMIEGARRPFVEEAEALFALSPQIRPLESYDAALARVAALLPGAGPVAARAEAFRRRFLIPRDRLEAVAQAAIAECRRRTAAHLDLPADERFDLEIVTGKSWGAYNYYLGGHRSLIQINADAEEDVGGAIATGCHEGYPGHHVQGLFNERAWREKGWVELSIVPLYAPVSPLAEGGGDYGVDLAFTPQERSRFLREVLFPLAGLDPQSAALYEAVEDARRALDGVSVTIAQLYLDGEIDRARAIALTQRYRMTSRENAARAIAFVEQYRSYIINYSEGARLIRAYVERGAPDEAARWARFRRILGEPILPSDLQDGMDGDN